VSIAEDAMKGGAVNVLEALLEHWTDDNATNKMLVETLLRDLR
jgi:hypothetical protein